LTRQLLRVVDFDGGTGIARRRLDRLVGGRRWQRQPDRARKQADNLAPAWRTRRGLGDFADFAADGHCIGRACLMITALGPPLRHG
jgi:hypothetical protein